MRINIKNINIVNVLLSLVIILDYINAVFPACKTYLNIACVGVIFLIYFICYYSTISASDIFVLFVSIILIAIDLDISRISLFVSFILLSKSKLYDKNTIRDILVTSVVCMTVIIVAYLFGFNKKYDTSIWRPLLGKTVSRMSFGFTHPNQFMIRLFAIFLLIFAYTRSKFIKLITLCLVVLFYYLTQSRTVPLIIAVVVCSLVLLYCFSKFSRRKFKLYRMLPYLFLLMTFISIFISLIFANTTLDAYLSGRLRINKNYLLNYFSLFGNKSLEEAMFDNSYIQMLLTKGIIYFLAYAFILYRSIENRRFSTKVSILLISVFVLGFMEVVLLKYPVMICMGILINTGKRRGYGSQNNKLLLVRK